MKMMSILMMNLKKRYSQAIRMLKREIIRLKLVRKISEFVRILPSIF